MRDLLIIWATVAAGIFVLVALFSWAATDDYTDWEPDVRPGCYVRVHHEAVHWIKPGPSETVTRTLYCKEEA